MADTGLTPPRYHVSLAATGFVTPAAKPEATSKGQHDLDYDSDDDDDELALLDEGMAVRLHTLQHDFSSDIDAIEAFAEEFTERMLAKRATDDAEVLYDDDWQEVVPMYKANSRGDLIRRDPQFNYLRKWFLAPKCRGPSAAAPVCTEAGEATRRQSLTAQRIEATDGNKGAASSTNPSRRQSDVLPRARSTLSFASEPSLKMSDGGDGGAPTSPLSALGSGDDEREQPRRRSGSKSRRRSTVSVRPPTPTGLIGPHIVQPPKEPTAEAADEALATVIDLGLRASKARNLERVTLSEFPLTTRELYLLSTRLLTTSFNITHLALPHCGMTTATLVPICHFLESGTSTITNLDVSYNQLDELACKALESALAKSKVTTLSVRGNTLMTADAYSTSILYLLLGNRLLSIDLGFTGLCDNAIVKLCTVLRSHDTRVRSINIDGADISQRVILFLLDAVTETRRIIELSTAHIYNCNTPQFANRLAGILARNKQLLAAAGDKPKPSLAGDDASFSAKAGSSMSRVLSGVFGTATVSPRNEGVPSKPARPPSTLSGRRRRSSSPRKSKPGLSSKPGSAAKLSKK